MKFLIIIPAHNEERNLSYCLQSLQNQSFENFRIVIVDDGSQDKTAETAKKFAEKDSRFSVFSLDSSAHQPGAKVVRTFNYGLATENIGEYDVICKFDADIIFPENYLKEVSKIYEENPRAGMVSGIVKIKKSIFENALAFDFKDQKHQWIFENLSSKNHVRGPIKSYRKECFEAIGGLRPVLGWDNIDVMLAKMHGFEVVTIKNLWVKHLRPTAYKYKNQKAEKLGEYFYNIGLNFPLAAVSSAKSSFKNKSWKEFFITMKSFFRQNSKRNLSPEEIKYIRKLRWREMWQNFTK